MASVQLFKSDVDPAILEAEVNAELASNTNAVLAHWDVSYEGNEVIFFADLEIISPTAGMGARTLQFKVFGGNVMENVWTQYRAWRGGLTNIKIHDVKAETYGTYNLIAVLFSVGV